MANFTQKAIKDSFIKLLNEKPLSKISVKDIVEDCGINRNSFYYHFQDIPTLLESIITEEADRMIEEYPKIESLENGLQVGLSFAIQNKNAVLHIYNSTNRDIYEQYLIKVCRHVVSKYLDTVFSDVTVDPEDKEITIRLVSCSLFGLIIEWMNTGMNEERLKDIERCCEICKGIPDVIVERAKKN